ncbi:MAG: ABC transporter permease [Methylobacter sp.]|uniref:ABC transporter permease n=1 Tax=Candidatus Methylobacter titanis TaxID=3053457 RepID=A0AA43TJA2_9GAMM|nr:ABC transporter permease [Candidatus Methylobacter titanis]MDI1292831.1 ABC transporter permease [Candidatus Methylobacter titanis]
MHYADLILLSYRTVISHKLRSALTALGLIIGIAAVVVLTSIGRGIHTFVLAEFTQFGTNLISIHPGKTTTFGVSGATISTVRPLVIADAVSLRNRRNIISVSPMVQGNAQIKAGKMQRRTNVLGVGSAVPEIWKIKVVSGRFLPEEESNPRAFAVLGNKLATELFGTASPLGQRIRIGSDRFRVIGVMEKKGQTLGFDMDDTIYIPAAKALELFNRESLMEIHLLYQSNAAIAGVENAIKRHLIARHGREDFTVVTQNQMLKSMDSILNILTLAVAALGSISLLVGSVGILTIMTIAVSERISEIGLLRAVGAERRTIFQLFLCEALALSGAGGLCGVLLGIAIVKILEVALPALPVELAWAYIVAAFMVSLLIGIAAGVVPAMKAARLEPLEALRAE